MLDRFLNFVAGVDGRLMANCPPTDRMWARQLGYSLCLSFTIVFGISLYSLGYIIPEMWLRLPVALVIALTLFLFDRALFQSDWFHQNSAPETDTTVQTEADAGRSLARFGRIAMRLSISLVLASVIAAFLELAMFSSTITERIEANRVAANQPLFEKMAAFEAGVDAAIDQQKATLDELQQALQNSYDQGEPAAATGAGDAIDTQIRTLDAREQVVLGELAQIEPSLQAYASQMNAEEFGQRLNADSSMRAGLGPRYEYARRQKEMLEQQAALRGTELAQIQSKREALKSERSAVIEEAQRQRAEQAAKLEQKRNTLQSQIATARAELLQSQQSRQPRIDAQWRKLRTEYQYHEAQAASDPLTRMAAFQELKNDPKQGATITAVSWMTRLFIIFLEVVPVIAKIFFSPPSVYAARIQAEVARGVRRIEDGKASEVIDLRETEAPSLVPAQPAGLDVAIRELTALHASRNIEPERRVEERRKLMRRAAERGSGKKMTPARGRGSRAMPRVTPRLWPA